jgi:hypothetical protein
VSVAERSLPWLGRWHSTGALVINREFVRSLNSKNVFLKALYC